MKTNKLFTFLILGLFLISFASADWSFDNAKHYNSVNREVTITNSFGFGSDIGKARLNTPLNVQVAAGKDRLVAEFDIWAYEDYENILKQFTFTNLKNGNGINKDYTLKYFSVENIEVNDYKIECKEINGKFKTNLTNNTICSKIKTGSHIEVIEEWKELKNSDLKKNEKLTVGVFVDVELGDYVDWVPTIYGVKIEEWATWEADIKTNLISYYKMDNSTGNLIDVHGSNDGTISGATYTSSGKINGARDFESSNSNYITMGDASDFEHLYTGARTISAWVKVETIGSMAICSKNSVTGPIYPGWEFTITSSGELSYTYIYNNPGNRLTKTTDSAVITAGIWYYVVMVYNNEDVKFYVNGTLTSSEYEYNTLSASITSTTSFDIGARADTLQLFDGLIDEVGIFDRVLNSTEIEFLYNEGIGLTYEDDGITDIAPTITLNSPTADANYTTHQSLTFNFSVSDDVKLSDVKLYVNDVLNQTNATGINNSVYLFDLDLGDGEFEIYAKATDNESLTTKSGAINIFINSIKPQIDIEAPNETIDYGAVGSDETLNVTFTDTNLDSCWYNYNGTNVSIPGCLTGVKNSTTFTLESGNTNMTLYANDTLGNTNSSFIEWDYLIFENNVTYNEEVLDLSLEDYTLYVQATEEITDAKMNYNGTDYESNILSLGDGLYEIWNSIQVPDIDTNTNETFYFNLTVSGLDIITQEYNQSVYVLLIDDCSGYTNEIFNISLYDEKNLEDLDGTIEVNLELFNADKSTALTTTQQKFYNLSNSRICTNVNLTDTGYYYDLEMRYYVDPTNTSTFTYVPEFYHIQKAETSNFPQQLNLYNLNVNQSTEFEMYYRNNNYVAEANVLLQVERKYVSEGIYRTVEIPITSNEGTAIAHFDLDNYKYKILATKDGEVMNVFDNPAIVCESELYSTCTLELNGISSAEPYQNIDDRQGISYSITQGENNLTIEYSIPSGETKSVRVWAIQSSPFQDPTTICNSSITSSSGSFICPVNSTIGDSEVTIFIEYNGFIKQATAYFQEDLNIIFQKNNYAIAALFIIFLVTLFVSSPKIMVTVAIFSVVILGLLFLIKGASIGLVTGVISYLIIAGIIILIKINKKDET